MDMIEKVAKAMFHAECETHQTATGYGDIFGWGDAMPAVRERLMASARAAIEAVKDNLLMELRKEVYGNNDPEKIGFESATAIMEAALSQPVAEETK